MTRKDKMRALREAFYRSNLPNMMNLFSTAFIFLLVIYLQGFRVEIPIKSNRFRGQHGTYPIKLFYTSNMPIMLQSAIVSQIYFISQILYNKFPTNIFVRLLGIWEPKDGQFVATSGLAYFISPPDGILNALKNPIHFIVYVVFVLSASALFFNTCMEVSGSAPKDIAKMLKDQQMTMRGHRQGSMYKELKRVIPVAACLGGLVVGALSITADLIGNERESIDF